MFNKHDNNENELKDLENLLDPVATIPDKVFAKELRSEFLHQASPNLFLTTLFMTRKQKLLAGSLFAGILVVAGLSAFLIYNNQQSSKLAEQDTLSKIFAQNPDIESLNTKGENATASDSSKLQAGSLVHPGIGLAIAGYYHSTSTITKGPKYSQCTASAYYHPAGEGTMESWSYSAEGGYMGKSIAKDVNGNIVEYSFNTPEQSIIYAGGQYAVALPAYDLAILSSAKSAEESTPDSISSDTVIIDPLPADPQTSPYVPDGAKLEETTESGTPAYLVTWSTKAFCADGSEKDVTYKIYSRKDNFQVLKEQLFIGGTSASDMIAQMEAITEQSDTLSSSEQAGIFKFDLDVAVKDYSDKVLDEASIKELTKSFLAGSSLSVALADLSKYQASWVQARELQKQLDPQNAYTLDRAYYRAGAEGDKAYSEFKKNYDDYIASLPILRVDQNNQSESKFEYVNTQVFGKSASDRIVGVEGMENRGTVNITVDGRVISANLYSYAAVRPESVEPAPDTGGGVPGDTGSVAADQTISFVLGDYRYIVSYNTTEPPVLTTIAVRQHAEALVAKLN